VFVGLDVDSVVEHLDGAPNLVIDEMVVGFDLMADEAFQMLRAEIGIENSKGFFHVRRHVVKYVFAVLARGEFLLDFAFELFDVFIGIAFAQITFS
jgi:hypothetical protein